MTALTRPGLWRIFAWLPGLLAILLLAGLTLWLRALPDKLTLADEWASLNLRSQVAGQLDPRLPPGQRDAALDNLMRSNAQVVAEAHGELAEAFRHDLSFQGGDGRRHLFLSGDDSYYFLRQARDILRHGSLCGLWRAGQCIDTAADAPLGRAVERPYAIHPYAIAALHRLLLLATPGLPLTVAATLLPTLLTLLALPLVFLALRRLLGREGPDGGVVAATLGTALTLLNLPLIGRSLSADNDIWVTLLPLLSALLLCLALRPGRPWRSILPAALAGLALGLLASNWGGWQIYLAVFLTSLGGLFGHGLMAHFCRQPSQAQFRQTVITLAAWLLTLAPAAWLLAGGLDFAQWLHDLLKGLHLAPAQITASPIPEANAFAAVAELQKVPFTDLPAYFGMPMLLLGLPGALLGLLPPGWPRRWRLAFGPLALGLLAVCAWLWPERGFQALALGIAMLAAPLTLLHARGGGRLPALPLITAVWLFVALMLSQEGQRYLLILGTPLGLGVALATAFLAREAWPLLAKYLPAAAQRPAAAVGLALLLAVALPSLQLSAREARLQQPRLNAAWAEVLGHIRQRASANSLIASWWDYGHYITYLAERPAIVDGASLRFTTVHWIGRVLSSAEPAEARGLLRMLACGGTSQGTRPYEALLAGGLNRAQALELIGKLARLDQAEAQLLLETSGLPPLLRGMVLRHTHCQAPPQILVTTDALLKTPAWALSGLWNPDLAWLLEAVRNGTDIGTTATRLNLPAPGLAEITARARAAQDDMARAMFAAPGAAMWSERWHGCQPAPPAAANPPAANRQSCTLNLRGPDGTWLHRLYFDPANPGDLVLDGTHPLGMAIMLRPQLVRVALADRLVDLALADGAELAVIVDPERRRVFVATPAIAQSLALRLTLLEGRYDTGWLERLSTARSLQGETVAAWRVR